MQARHRLAVALFSTLAVPLAGCDGGGAVGRMGTPISTAPVTRLGVRIEHPTGFVDVTESPLFVGSPVKGEWHCGWPDVTPLGVRLVCSRASARLDLVVGRTDHAGAAIYYPKGFTAAERTYLRCQAEPFRGHIPSALDCTQVVPVSLVDGNFVSPFASSVPGLDIRNSHVLEQRGGARLIRGMAPLAQRDYEQLSAIGVKSVLVFKDPESPTHSEIPGEIRELLRHGIRHADNIQFKWRHFPDFKTPCAQTVTALHWLAGELAAGRTTFFHCTVGEDRTGYLAGLYRMLTEHIDLERAFREEMCEMGYSAGNAQKPYDNVIQRIDEDLTPIFLRMARAIERAHLSMETIDASICDSAAADDLDVDEFRCPMSLRYRL
jgi:hypothetical protein